MPTISGFPSITITYRKSGNAARADHVKRLHSFVKNHQLDDLLVISHGWNNSKTEAMGLYKKLLAQIKLHRAQEPKLKNRKVGILAVIWPSKRFKAFEQDTSHQGGAASVSPEIDDPIKDAKALIQELDQEITQDQETALVEATQAAVNDEGHWPAFLETLRNVLPFNPNGMDEADALLFEATADPDQALAQFDFVTVDGQSNAFTGGAAGGGGGGAAGAVGSILNYTTFYVMKRRAGDVGNHGLARSVVGLRRAKSDLRIHFVGHSFGARVVAMAALALDGHPLSAPNSMTLLQAAFSHNSFSAKFPPPQKPGFFRGVMTKPCVNGPILVTHTFNDTPVRVAYSIASALAGQNASFTQSTPSQYGGLGANGALHMGAEAIPGKLLAAGASGYAFKKSKIFNLESSQFIKSHSDVKSSQIGYAIVKAMVT
ncbi:hypothetical protein [Roseovarius sp. EL26]|uniref:hypothetical protein n=1 Tax=Roseovarius sp. EL26 TaxID=2126672 RepID=UPI000EA39A1C|nr:hypothetical protein [Roseovarius sp. EL26]